MITAGIDVGLEYAKVLILKDGDVLAAVQGLSGGMERREAVRALWEEALEAAGLAAGDVDSVWATGQGKYDVDFAADNVVEAVADARAARFLYPKATCAIDLGADQIRKMTLGEGEKIVEVVTSQKCGTGIGVQLQVIARRLGLTLEEMAGLDAGAAAVNDTVIVNDPVIVNDSVIVNDPVIVNDGCPVFAELDALELLNRGVAPRQVAAAVVEAAAVRINAVLNDKLLPAEDSTVLMGGMTHNAALVAALKARSGVAFLIPRRPEYCGALGAALMAAG